MTHIRCEAEEEPSVDVYIVKSTIFFQKRAFPRYNKRQFLTAFRVFNAVSLLPKIHPTYTRSIKSHVSRIAV